MNAGWFSCSQLHAQITGLQEIGENKNEYSKKNRFEITSCESVVLKWLALN